MDRMVETLKDWGAPVEKSALSVCGYFYDHLNVREWSEKRFETLIKDLTGEDITFADPRKEARTTTMHLIQETMLASIGTDQLCTFQQDDLPAPKDIPPLDPKALLADAIEWAKNYIEKNPWVFAETEDDEEKLDVNGNPKPKKGSKGARSYELYCELVGEGATRKEIIAAFQDEDRMAPSPPHTKSGATTYFYNMKRKYLES